MGDQGVATIGGSQSFKDEADPVMLLRTQRDVILPSAIPIQERGKEPYWRNLLGRHGGTSTKKLDREQHGNEHRLRARTLEDALRGPFAE